MTVKHYFANPLVFDFMATVLESIPQGDGTQTVILDETYFYPTGGGQSHDVGTLNGQPVLDVRKEDETVLHIVQGETLTGRVTGVIDADIRQRNMAAHTGQHILSAVLLRELNANTLAVRISADGLSTVDVDVPDIKSKVSKVESQVNQVIRENRAVKSRFVAPDAPELEQLRRAVKFDKVTGDVRLVEIEGVDLSACAGTHFPSTGMLGLLKILKVENYKGGSRIHFAVREEALQQYNLYQQIVDEVSNMLSSGIEQIPDLVSKLQSERSDLAKQVASQADQLLSYEAQAILDNADSSTLLLSFQERDASALRTLTNHLIDVEADTVCIVNQQGADVMLIIATAESNPIHAGETLRTILAEFDGRGGGRDGYAQGILKAFDDTEALLDSAKQHLS